LEKFGWQSRWLNFEGLKSERLAVILKRQVAKVTGKRRRVGTRRRYRNRIEIVD